MVAIIMKVDICGIYLLCGHRINQSLVFSKLLLLVQEQKKLVKTNNYSELTSQKTMETILYPSIPHELNDP